MNGLIRQCVRSLSTQTQCTHKVCIVGAGPAGFYTAQQILKGDSKVEVDIYDRLPVPFGLVRYGVAPDHPEVKNVTNTFTNILKNTRTKFVGNVNVGTDVSVQNLRDNYHAIVLSYGCEEDYKLGVPGEDNKNILSAREFVNWYNGLPDSLDIDVDLSCEKAVVIGQGNVAIDVARMMLTPIDLLSKTDITESSLEALSNSKIKEVVLVGRRGPLNAAFTIKEFREMINLPETKPDLLKQDYTNIVDKVKDITRARKRLTDLLVKTALEPTEKQLSHWKKAKKSWSLKFLRSPKSFVADDTGKVTGITLTKNELEGEYPKQTAVPTSEIEDLSCGLVLRSVGYRGLLIDDLLPFDMKKGILMNEKGRVTGLPGIYSSGWIQSGPVGVIISTMNSGFETGKLLLKDIETGSLENSPKEGYDGITKLLKQKGIPVCNFKDWQKLDAVETERGKAKGKPREKVTSVSEMLKIMKG